MILTEKDELECCLSILDFLLENAEPPIPTPMQSKMDKILSKFGTDMVPFTQYLNNKYQIYDGLLWSYSAKEFFSTTKSIGFYKTIIRKLKIDLIYA